MNKHITTKRVPYEAESLKGVTSIVYRCLNCNEVGTTSDLASEKDQKAYWLWFEKNHKRCAELYKEKQMEAKAK